MILKRSIKAASCALIYKVTVQQAVLITPWKRLSWEASRFSANKKFHALSGT